ncbi:hypothetical protein R1flu_013046 [Riccia fluitans]|uniref:Uncharacterized protein n=1 Tax=Riccia fluitans TaxID=41844 RepID=A0ABD1ZDK6_9MARC
MLSLLGFSFFPARFHTHCTWRRDTENGYTSSRVNLSIGSVHSGAQKPSLRRGWILEPKLETGGGNCAVEVLLSPLDEAENEKVQESWEPIRNETAQLQVEREMALVPEAKYVRGADLRKASFVRVYYIPALRVPAKDSGTLAHGLEEHLLNWPRVSNIARVSGYDVAEDLQSLFLRMDEVGESSGRGIRSAQKPFSTSSSLQALLQSQSRCQLVTCRLTLFYEYWSSEEVLRDLLPHDIMVPGPFER